MMEEKRLNFEKLSMKAKLLILFICPLVVITVCSFVVVITVHRVESGSIATVAETSSNVDDTILSGESQEDIFAALSDCILKTKNTFTGIADDNYRVKIADIKTDKAKEQNSALNIFSNEIAGTLSGFCNKESKFGTELLNYLGELKAGYCELGVDNKERTFTVKPGADIPSFYDELDLSVQKKAAESSTIDCKISNINSELKEYMFFIKVNEERQITEIRYARVKAVSLSAVFENELSNPGETKIELLYSLTETVTPEYKETYPEVIADE